MEFDHSFIQSLGIADFDYDLPDECIAKYPLEKRDQSKLLIYKDQKISETIFSNIGSFFEPNDQLIYNSTKVIPARIRFQKKTGATIEVFCLEPVSPNDYLLSLQSNKCTWKCIVGQLKKWKEPELQKEIITEDGPVVIKATRIANLGTYQHIEFTWNSCLTFSEIIDIVGVTPIPPYLNRESEPSDKLRYQTVYSKTEGSVAAPTAGLHFTDSLISQLSQKGVLINELTLHVGAGTFKPVQTEMVKEHEMHTEFFSVPKETIQNLALQNGNVYAVGTTTLRTLESLYWFGIKIKNQKITESEPIHLNQWDAYQLQGNLTYAESLGEVLNYLNITGNSFFVGTTQIMIVPGYQIRSIQALITNFHQPKSTLLLLISAITGLKWKEIYDYALQHRFRFLSYGDSSLLYL